MGGTVRLRTSALGIVVVKVRGSDASQDRWMFVCCSIAPVYNIYFMVESQQHADVQLVVWLVEWFI